MSPRLRSLLINLARIGISGVLLAWILSQTGLERLGTVLQSADPWPYAGAVLLGLIGIGLRAWRWKVLLDAVGVRLPLPRLIYLYFVGAFFNAFLPTGFGGDVVRVLEFGQGAHSSQAAGTALVDRLTGFIMLFALALAALPFAGALLPPSLTGLIAALGAGVLLGSALLFEGRLLPRLTAGLGRWPLTRPLSLAGDGWLARTYGVIAACGRGALLRALGVSLIFNLVILTAGWLIAATLRLTIAPATLAAFIPVATATLLVPISISGLGVREGVYVALFAQVGIADAQAVAFSLLFYSIDLATGLVGGLLYLGSSLARLRRPDPA
ncbi:MAG: flippase-like domain-containing protein [Anaerolineales bacterium]|nr:flippase-like domain-containing protein [Anaerolineales bacterium]